MGAAMLCKKRVTVTSSSQVTRAALYKEWRKLETISADQLNEVKSRNEVNKEAQKDKRKVHFAILMDIRLCEKYKDNMENAQRRRVSVSTRIWKQMRDTNHNPKALSSAEF